MNLVKVFSFDNSNITFKNEDGKVMVNATEMAKKFNKRAADWLENRNAKEFIEALADTRKSVSADYVLVVKGGINQGTWMHEDVAIEFARWLSPKFAIWTNDRIKELLKGEHRSETLAESIYRQALLNLENERRLLTIENEIKEIKAHQTTHPQNYFSVAGFGSLKGVNIDVKLAAKLGRLASRLCRENGYHIGSTVDPRFGKVNTYPDEVLNSVYADLNLLVNSKMLVVR